MREDVVRYVLAVILALMVAASAYAETRDECVVRLSQDLSVTTYAEAAAWWEQVEQECAPLPNKQEEYLTLSSDRMEEWHALPKSGCRIKYSQQPDLNSETPIIIPYVVLGRPELYYNSSNGWTQMQGTEAESESDLKPMMYTEPLVFGVGLHEIEVKTERGIDRFAVRETKGAIFVVSIWCP